MSKTRNNPRGFLNRASRSRRPPREPPTRHLTFETLERRRLLDATITGTVLVKNFYDRHLRSTKLTDAGMRHLRNLKELQFLDCKDVPLSDAGLEHIGTLSRLTCLDLSGTRVTSAGMKFLINLKTLDTLDLSGTRIGDEGMASIAKLPSLAFLCVSSTDVGDRGLEKLVAAPVREIYVQRTKVTDAGAEPLQRRGVIVHDVPQHQRSRNFSPVP